MEIPAIDNHANRIFCLPCSCVPPRSVRIALSILGIGICIGGITIGAIGLSSIPATSLPFWLNKTISVLGTGGCIGLIFGSYILGTFLAEVGKDPIHSKTQAHHDNISTLQNMIEIATRIPRIILSTILDLVLLIPYGLFLIYHRLKSTPLTQSEDTQSGKEFIILIHGTNSNSGVWEFGKHFLQNKRYGTIIEINLEENGSVMNDSSKGIDDYAQFLIHKLTEIKSRSGGEARFTCIGHSMGGLVVSYAAEYLADNAEILIDRIFTISTPWQGSPLLDVLPNAIKPKRFHQMTESNGALTSLVQKVSDSNRFYCTFGSTTDAFVPACYSFININIQNHRYPFLGHLGIVALPFVWLKICNQLDEVYKVH